MNRTKGWFKIGRVEIMGGPNPQFIGITLLIFLLNWVAGLIWLGFWFALAGGVIAWLNLRSVSKLENNNAEGNEDADG